MMKIFVALKTPDALTGAIKDALRNANVSAEDYEDRYSEARGVCSLWFKYDELVQIEIDTETQTATVKPVINVAHAALETYRIHCFSSENPVFKAASPQEALKMAIESVLDAPPRPCDNVAVNSVTQSLQIQVREKTADSAGEWDYVYTRTSEGHFVLRVVSDLSDQLLKAADDVDGSHIADLARAAAVELKRKQGS